MTTCGCCPFGKKKTAEKTDVTEDVGQRYENVVVGQPDQDKEQDSNTAQLNYIQVEFANTPSKAPPKFSVKKQADSNGVTYSEVTVSPPTIYENTE